MTRRRKVLVTGTGATGLGWAVIQALSCGDGAEDRWEITAADAHPFSVGLCLAGRAALLPWADDPGYLDAVKDLIAAEEPAAVIPGTEAETVILADHRDELGGAVVVANEAALMPLMRNKRLAARRLAEMGVCAVPSYPWTDRYAAVAEYGWPVVVKPTWESSGARGVFVCCSWLDLDSLPPFLDAEHAPAVYPYLGDCADEYSVMVLSDRDGEVIDSLVIHRELVGLSLREERQHKGRRLAVSTGYTQGTIVAHPEIQGMAEDLAKRLGSRGPLDLQLRLVDGVPHVFEVQPRFSFSAPIRASAGFNEPDTLLRNFLDGKKFGRLGYQTGVAAIRFLDHVLVPADTLLR